MGNASTASTGPFPAGRNRDLPSSADNMLNAGPGWYYDPDDQAIYRYWDGTQWTEHRSDTVLSEVPA